MKPKLLDLFCGAGGCAKGYQEAGFYVVGVDHLPQKNYCGDEFYQADAMTFPLDGFDVIHASPPCQAFTAAKTLHKRNHPDLLTPTRQRLQEQETPWVIENVPGAPMRRDLILCGTMFPELRVRRHRWFEFSFPFAALVSSCDHSRPCIQVFGTSASCDKGPGGVKGRAGAMGIDWMISAEMAQAIPPAYTKFIGERLLEHLKVPA